MYLIKDQEAISEAYYAIASESSNLSLETPPSQGVFTLLTVMGASDEDPIYQKRKKEDDEKAEKFFKNYGWLPERGDSYRNFGGNAQRVVHDIQSDSINIKNPFYGQQSLMDHDHRGILVATPAYLNGHPMHDDLIIHHKPSEVYVDYDEPTTIKKLKAAGQISPGALKLLKQKSSNGEEVTFEELGIDIKNLRSLYGAYVKAIPKSSIIWVKIIRYKKSINSTERRNPSLLLSSPKVEIINIYP